MPRPCAVEVHVSCSRKQQLVAIATNVKLHGASPWHLGRFYGFPDSNERESPRRKAVASFCVFTLARSTENCRDLIAYHSGSTEGIQVGPAPNSMQTSQTIKNPSSPATALKTQINEVSISSGMFFCPVMGETLCIDLD